VKFVVERRRRGVLRRRQLGVSIVAGGNNRTLFSSESYNNTEDALAAINHVKANATAAGIEWRDGIEPASSRE
jgi:uncharacterized protein YegP (UPF0339 family)